MIRDYHDQLLEKYHNQYNLVLKPLLATVEAEREEQPEAILNEIRAFNDHIARCYLPDATAETIKNNLDKAGGHLKRATLDCFKTLNIHYHDLLKKFDRECKHVDLTVVDNGEFYKKYKRLKKEAKLTVREAKKLEAINPKEAFEKFERGYELFDTIVEFLYEKMDDIDWAKKRFFCNKTISILLWFVTFAAGTILAALCSPVSDWIKSLFSAAK